jgi:protease stability complex PrcB-like protein
VLSQSSVLALLCAICCAAAAANPVAFTPLERGQQSNIESAREVVVRTAAEWTALWKQHALDRPRPAVDFTRSMVVGVFLGSRPTGGHSVEITRIDREGTDLVVTYRERRPAASDIVTQVITMPYDLVTIEPFAGPVRFIRAR